MGVRIVAHIILGLFIPLFYVIETMRNFSSGFGPSVCPDITFRTPSVPPLKDRPHPFFTLFEIIPLTSFVRSFPLFQALSKPADFYLCLTTPSLMESLGDPWMTVFVDALTPIFVVLAAWIGVEALKVRSSGPRVARWIIQSPLLTIAVAQMITTGAGIHLISIPAWLLLDKNVQVTRLPSTPQLTALLVHILILAGIMSSFIGAPETVALWLVSMFHISVILAPLLCLTSPHKLFSSPLLAIIKPKTGIGSPHPLYAFWTLIAGIAAILNFQFMTRLITFVYTYDWPVPANYGLPTPTSYIRPPLDKKSLNDHLFYIIDRASSNRIVTLCDLFLSTLALQLIQFERFTTIWGFIEYTLESLILGRAASFALWQRREWEDKSGCVEEQIFEAHVIPSKKTKRRKNT